MDINTVIKKLEFRIEEHRLVKEMMLECLSPCESDSEVTENTKARLTAVLMREVED